jgi:SAM-dependent methyltransferase
VTPEPPAGTEYGADDLPQHVAANRAAWDDDAVNYVGSGERSWRLGPGEERWGLFGIPEAQVRMLPDDLEGRDAIELGCGTAYVSAWMARRGARVAGIDNSPKQLETARRLQAEHGLEFPLLLGNAERVPLPDASFDLAISEYGAVLWADPEAWVPEAARLLRPGGRLHVLTNHLLVFLTAPDDADAPVGDRLLRPMFGMGRISWTGETSVEFHLTHGAWIDLFRRSGFEVEELLEPQVPRGRDDELRVDAVRLGPPVAVRGGLEGPQARLTAAACRRFACARPMWAAHDPAIERSASRSPGRATGCRPPHSLRGQLPTRTLRSQLAPTTSPGP